MGHGDLPSAVQERTTLKPARGTSRSTERWVLGVGFLGLHVAEKYISIAYKPSLWQDKHTEAKKPLKISKMYLKI